VQPDFGDDRWENIVQEERRDIDRAVSLRDCYLLTTMNYAIAKPLNRRNLLPERLDVASALEGA